MLARRRFSIKTKLLLIYLLITVPLVILLGISFYGRYRSDQDAIIAERLDIARLAASNFNLFISQTVLAETIIGNTIIDQQLGPQEASSFLSRTVRRHPASDIMFLDANGTVVASSSINVIAQDRSQDLSVRAIIGGEDVAIGNLQRDADDSPIFTIATGIKVNNTLAGIVSMSIKAEDLHEVMDIAVRVGGVNIVDSSGRVVFQSQAPDIPFDERNWGDEPFVRTALAGETFTSTGLTFPLDGSFRTGAEIPITHIGWAAGSFAPVDEVLAPVTRAAALSTALALAIIIITLLLAILLGNRLVSGLVVLKQHMSIAPKAGLAEHVMLSTGDEIEDLANNFNRMQDEILSAQAKERKLREEIEDRNRELAILYETQKNVASVLQESLLPKIAQRIDRLEIGLDFQSATEAAFVGGDFYDFIEISDGVFGIVIGDVSGKGIEAATLTATVRNTLRAFAYDEASPASAVEKVNNIIARETPPAIFVTLFYGVFDARTHDLTYANAGHWPPIIFRPNENRIEDLEAGGLPLGAFSGVSYKDNSAKLFPGATMILYTDGVIESRVRKELFGVERVHQIIRTHTDLSPGELAETIVGQAKAFSGGELYDDAAVMVIRVVD